MYGKETKVTAVAEVQPPPGRRVCGSSTPLAQPAPWLHLSAFSFHFPKLIYQNLTFAKLDLILHKIYSPSIPFHHGSPKSYGLFLFFLFFFSFSQKKNYFLLYFLWWGLWAFWWNNFLLDWRVVVCPPLTGSCESQWKGFLNHTLIKNNINLATWCRLNGSMGNYTY